MLKHLFPLTLAMVFGAQAMADETDIRKDMEAKLGTKVESVTKSGYMGLYEVYADGQLLYTDEKMTTIIVGGQLIDAKTMKSSRNIRTPFTTPIGPAFAPPARIATCPRNGGRR